VESGRLPAVWRSLMLLSLGWKMEAAGFCKSPVPISQTTHHHISENNVLSLPLF